MSVPSPRAPHAQQALELVRQRNALIRRLVAHRSEMNLSAKDVADKLDLNKSTISRFESGESDPHLSTILRYALAVGSDLKFEVSSSA